MARPQAATRAYITTCVRLPAVRGSAPAAVSSHFPISFLLLLKKSATVIYLPRSAPLRFPNPRAGGRSRPKAEGGRAAPRALGEWRWRRPRRAAAVTPLPPPRPAAARRGPRRPRHRPPRRRRWRGSSSSSSATSSRCTRRFSGASRTPARSTRGRPGSTTSSGTTSTASQPGACSLALATALLPPTVTWRECNSPPPVGFAAGGGLGWAHLDSLWFLQLRHGCERGEGGGRAHAQATSGAGQGSGSAPGFRGAGRAGDDFSNAILNGT